MHVLFSIIPGHGHFYPLIPLGNSLRRAGHRVTFATSQSYLPTIIEFGFDVIAVGPDYTQITLATEHGPAAVERMMFNDAPPLVMADLLHRFDSDAPDAVLVDPVEAGGFVAAEAAGIPAGCVLNGFRTGFMPGMWPFEIEKRADMQGSASLVGRLRQSAGIPDPGWTLGESFYDRSLNLVMAPPSFQALPLHMVSHTAHPLRPEPHVGTSPEKWLDDLGDRPIVSISFGTLFGHPELYISAIHAALETEATVVVATPFDLGIDHPRVIQRDWIAMGPLLGRTDVMVHHGGWGSTIAALASGTPSAVIPIGAEQPLNAARVEATGAGIVVPPGRITDDLSTAIGLMLSSNLYQGNAGRLADEIAAMPDSDAAVPLIETLAEEGVVFNKDRDHPSS